MTEHEREIRNWLAKNSNSADDAPAIADWADLRRLVTVIDGLRKTLQLVAKDPYDVLTIFDVLHEREPYLDVYQ